MPSLMQSLLVLSLAAAASRPIKICAPGPARYAYQQVVTWSGTLVELERAPPADISTETGQAGKALVLQLDAPISAISQGTTLDSECDQRQIQLTALGDGKSRAEALLGKRVKVTGALGHAFTADQQVPLILTVQSIAAEEPKKP